MSRLDDYVDRFSRRLSALHRCCERVEEQLADGRLLVQDVELVYGSTFLSACSSWESLLEEMLYEVVCGLPSRKKGNFRLAEFRSRGHFREVLHHPRKEYISMASVASVVQTASLFINEGRPFTSISEPNQTLLKQAFWIRNAIAHQSDFALRVFREKVPGVGSLPANKRVPGTFLRVVFRVSPTQRRYEPYFAAMQSASSELRQSW